MFLGWFPTWYGLLGQAYVATVSADVRFHILLVRQPGCGPVSAGSPRYFYKWRHTIPNFCGLLLAIPVYIYIYACMYIYIYICIHTYIYIHMDHILYIIPIHIYIYKHPYLGWFMMVSYRGWWGRFMNCGSEAHICAILILVVMRRTHVGAPWQRCPLCRSEPVTVLVDMEVYNENCSSDSSVTVKNMVVLIDIGTGLMNDLRISSYGTPVIKMTNPVVVPLDMAHFRSANRRCEMCCASWRFRGEPTVSAGRPKRAGTSKGRLPAIRKFQRRYAIRSKSWESSVLGVAAATLYRHALLRKVEKSLVFCRFHDLVTSWSWKITQKCRTTTQSSQEIPQWFSFWSCDTAQPISPSAQT